MAQLLRVIASGVREVRETQVYGLLAEGPVTAEALRDLLQNTTRDRHEVIIVAGEHPPVEPVALPPALCS